MDSYGYLKGSLFNHFFFCILICVCLVAESMEKAWTRLCDVQSCCSFPADGDLQCIHHDQLFLCPYQLPAKQVGIIYSGNQCDLQFTVMN